MRLNYKRIHIGRRTFKTALAVIVSLVIVSSYGATASKMIFAMLGAMCAMENTFKQSVESCLTQIVGMVMGAGVAVLLSYLPIPSLLMVGIGIVFIIVMYNVMGVHFSPNLPCLIIVMSCMNEGVNPTEYAFGRLWDTAIGLAAGMLINILILPYDNSLKICQTIEYLEHEVIRFMEDMFDGNEEYPDTQKAGKTIDNMASQLGIYSKQWLPFTMKSDKKKLEVFLRCESKSRALLAQMEVLSQMKHIGRLDAGLRKRLTDSGAVIQDKREISVYDEADIITNYHVEQILNLREELIEEIEGFSEKTMIK